MINFNSSGASQKKARIEMSIEYNTVIVRGFVIPEENYNNLPDEFIDQWVINFDSWCGGPYLVGYQIAFCNEGQLYELGNSLENPIPDNLLLEACREINLPTGPIKTYFGVMVS